jgi:lysophospholipase L1-like esterase
MNPAKNLFLLLFFLFSTRVFAQSELSESAIHSSLNYGKSVAVFGGSVSVIPPSEAAKDLWKAGLGMEITNYGVPGAGFSSLQGKSMQQQVDEAGVFDIYILWASTNDFMNQRENGSYTDYTEFDGYDPKKLETQAGGINYCIKKIYELNPNATIYFFTSSKAFSNRGGYDPFDPTGMASYVDLQKQICELHGIPYLDQFTLAGFNSYNQSLYYRDPIHMNEAGYKKLGALQVAFLAFPQ